jgi:UPF0755 protein
MGNLRVFLRFFIYLSLPLLVVFGTYQYLHGIFFEAYKPNARQKRVFVEIAPGLDFLGICKLLEIQKIIPAARNLNLYAKLRGGVDSIRPGEYVLSPSMTPKEILASLAAGKVYEREVVILPGVSAWEIGGLLNDQGIIEEDKFTASLTNPDLLARAGIPSASFEGYLAPGTYNFSRPVDPKKIIWTMLEAGEKNWPVEFSEQAEKIRLSRHEVLTIASIIDRTTEIPDERFAVSSVIHNRLTHGMQLESDVTLIYGLRDYSGILSDEDKQSPSPYNTFTNFGLPPGPISNPGIDAIRAALFPEETSYLYYFKSPLGRLEFSVTQAEHKRKLEKSLTE